MFHNAPLPVGGAISKMTAATPDNDCVASRSVAHSREAHFRAATPENYPRHRTNETLTDFAKDIAPLWCAQFIVATSGALTRRPSSLPSITHYRRKQGRRDLVALIVRATVAPSCQHLRSAGRAHSCTDKGDFAAYPRTIAMCVMYNSRMPFSRDTHCDRGSVASEKTPAGYLDVFPRQGPPRRGEPQRPIIVPQRPRV